MRTIKRGAVTGLMLLATACATTEPTQYVKETPKPQQTLQQNVPQYGRHDSTIIYYPERGEMIMENFPPFPLGTKDQCNVRVYRSPTSGEIEIETFYPIDIERQIVEAFKQLERETRADKLGIPPLEPRKKPIIEIRPVPPRKLSPPKPDYFPKKEPQQPPQKYPPIRRPRGVVSA